jgi:polyhydroxyalkanoate synthesis regulator phasin
MPDVEKILRMVEEGALTPEEADEVLATLASAGHPEQSATEAANKADQQADTDTDRARHLRVEITEGGRRVVNLRVPVNIASFAAGFVPGLPDDAAERIRQSIRDGLRGPIVDIASGDGDRVLIVNE